MKEKVFDTYKEVLEFFSKQKDWTKFEMEKKDDKYVVRRKK